MSHITHPKSLRLATLVTLAATALMTAAYTDSPDNSAQAPLDGTTTVTQVTTTTAVSTTPVTETLPAITVTETVTVEPTPASEPAPAPAPSENNNQLGFVAPPAAPAVAPEAVYYANCSEARAAGAAPIYVGEPGYSHKLDRDGDGIACE